MELLSFLLRQARWIVILATGVGIIGGVGSAGLMALINVRLMHPNALRGPFVWRFTGLILIVLLANVVSRMLLIRLSQQGSFDLRMDLSRRILASPLRHLEEIGPHRLLAALTEDVFLIANALLDVPILCINTAIVVGCLVYLSWLSWTAFLTLLAFLLLAVVGYVLLERRARRSLRLARDQWDALIEQLRAVTHGTKELKLHRRRREAFLLEILEPTAASLRCYNVSGRNLSAIAVSWGQVTYFIFIAFILLALPGLKDINIQTLTSYTLTALYMRTPIVVLLNIIHSFSRASISLQKLKELGLPMEGFDATDKSPMQFTSEPSFERLELLHITYTYTHVLGTESFTFGPIDITFHPGELVFVVGGNGSGKTTFVKLLTGLYIPDAGEIRMNGEPIIDDNREFYRQYFSVVFSDFYLFEQLLGLDHRDLDGRGQQYIAQFQLAHKVEVHNGKLSTTQLSHGQRKRLALLTAYLEDRPIYVFDEWAADQDPLFKEIFYLQLLPELRARGKSVIVVSHDEHHYHVADRIIKLNYGEVEYDTHLAHIQETGKEVSDR
jgi:putative ATP-binding cassette transporter